MYAKFINEYEIKYINPKKITLKGKQIFNPCEEKLSKLGYFEVVAQELPDLENEYCQRYIVKNDKIIQNWEVKEDV